MSVRLVESLNQFVGSKQSTIQAVRFSQMEHPHVFVESGKVADNQANNKEPTMVSPIIYWVRAWTS